jgi:hypothetical protein
VAALAAALAAFVSTYEEKTAEEPKAEEVTVAAPAPDAAAPVAAEATPATPAVETVAVPATETTPAPAVEEKK